MDSLFRSQGSLLGKIIFSQDVPFKDPNQENLVEMVFHLSAYWTMVVFSAYVFPTNSAQNRIQVSRKTSRTYGSGPFKILAYDCGIKNNIIRYLVSKNIELKVVPWDTDISKENYDGLFISNGPGDPTMASKTVEQVKIAFTQNKPIFGICLGNQVRKSYVGMDIV